MTIPNTANVVFVDSRGNEYDLMVDGTRKIKTANFHQYEWEKDVTEKRFGERLRAWRKSAKTYPVTLLFESSDRESQLNDFHDSLEYDIIHNQAGRLIWNDYYIECFGISSSTYPEGTATANDVTFYCPSPWWIKILHSDSITAAQSEGEETLESDLKTVTEEVTMTVAPVTFTDGTNSYAVILSTDDDKLRTFDSLKTSEGIDIDVSNSRFYPYPNDENKCYATVRINGDSPAVLINCEPAVFKQVNSITLTATGDVIYEIGSTEGFVPYVYAYALPDDNGSQGNMCYVTVPKGYEGLEVDVDYSYVEPAGEAEVTDDTQNDPLPLEDDEVIESQEAEGIPKTETVTVSESDVFFPAQTTYEGQVLTATYTTGNMEKLPNTFTINNDNVLGSKYILTIKGPCESPIVTIKNKEFPDEDPIIVSINVTVEEFDELVINSVDKTVLLYKRDVEQTVLNYFGARDPYNYLWYEVQGGENIVSWDEDFDLTLDLVEERSEPKWLTA